MFAVEVRSSEGMEIAIRRFAEHRMSFALDRLRNMRHISISIQDMNGPKGGIDKHCRIVAQFGFSDIVIEELQPTWQSATARAIHRLARKAAQEMQRARRSAPHRRRRSIAKLRRSGESGSESPRS